MKRTKSAKVIVLFALVTLTFLISACVEEKELELEEEDVDYIFFDGDISGSSSNINITGNYNTTSYISTPYYNATINEGVMSSFKYKRFSTADWQGGSYFGRLYISSFVMDTAVTTTNCNYSVGSDYKRLFCANTNAKNQWTFYETYINLRSYSASNYRVYNYWLSSNDPNVKAFNTTHTWTQSTGYTTRYVNSGAVGMTDAGRSNLMYAISFNQSVKTRVQDILDGTNWGAVVFGRDAVISGGVWFDQNIKILNTSVGNYTALSGFKSDPLYGDPITDSCTLSCSGGTHTYECSDNCLIEAVVDASACSSVTITGAGSFKGFKYIHGSPLIHIDQDCKVYGE